MKLDLVIASSSTSQTDPSFHLLIDGIYHLFHVSNRTQHIFMQNKGRFLHLRQLLFPPVFCESIGGIVGVTMTISADSLQPCWVPHATTVPGRGFRNLFPIIHSPPFSRCAYALARTPISQLNRFHSLKQLFIRSIE
jgi:hypothetical protein